MAPSSTEQSFRNNLSQFRWAQGVTDDSQPAQPAPASNPFSRFYNAVAGDYVPLRSSERSNEDEAWFALSRWERYVPFASLPLGVQQRGGATYDLMKRPCVPHRVTFTRSLC